MLDVRRFAVAALLMTQVATPPSFAEGLDLQRILGAKKVDLTNSPLGEWVPKLVMVSKGDDGSDSVGSCTGAFIADQVVLTAAHCVNTLVGKKLNPLVFTNGKVTSAVAPLAGVLSTATKGLDVYATEVAVPDDYVSAGGYAYGDIALIKLNRPVKTTARTKFVLHTAGEIPEGLTVTSIGWGNVTHEKNFFGSGVTTKTDGLNMKDFEVVSAATAGVPSIVTDRDSFLIRVPNGGEVGSICQGDSGGPSVVQSGSKFIIVGVASRTQSGCKGIGVLTSVAKHADWIRSTAARWGFKVNE